MARRLDGTARLAVADHRRSASEHLAAKEGGESARAASHSIAPISCLHPNGMQTGIAAHPSTAAHPSKQPQPIHPKRSPSIQTAAQHRAQTRGWCISYELQLYELIAGRPLA